MGGTYQTNLKELVSQQKEIIRVIVGMKYRDPAESAFKRFECYQIPSYQQVIDCTIHVSIPP